MRKMTAFLSLLVLLSLILSACNPATPEPTQVATVEPATEEAATAEVTEEAQPVETEAATEEATEEAVEETEATVATEPPAEEVSTAPKTLRLPDLEGQSVTAVTANDYTPLNFVDPLTGEAAGWEYEAVDEICRRLNCTVDWQVSSWDTMISAVREGQFDVGMDGISITPERAEQVDFSDPYMVSQQFMLVRAGEDRFATPEEFAADPDLLIGSQVGTTNFYTAVYEILDGDEANPRIKLFENFGAAVQALLSGDVDLVLLDAASSRGYIGANPDQLEIIGEPLGTEEFGFIFTPDSDLVEPFNAAIETMKQDGFLEHLNSRWFFLYEPAAQ